MNDALLKSKNERWATIRKKGRVRFVLWPILFLDLMLIGVAVSIALFYAGPVGLVMLGVRFIIIILINTGILSLMMYLWLTSWWTRAEKAYLAGIPMRTSDELTPPVVETYDFLPKE
ncbi:MAG: hypothetical protein ND895_27310 [Pyrinomonadaceae bacterium]|nr:hypothetical protein [Pyrinomonadaceae bacterium]